jgi:hypothetical protein
MQFLRFVNFSCKRALDLIIPDAYQSAGSSKPNRNIFPDGVFTEDDRLGSRTAVWNWNAMSQRRKSPLSLFRQCSLTCANFRDHLQFIRTKPIDWLQCGTGANVFSLVDLLHIYGHVSPNVGYSISCIDIARGVVGTFDLSRVWDHRRRYREDRRKN